MEVKLGDMSMKVHRVPIELTEPFYRDENKIMMPLDTVAYCFNLIVDRSDLFHITIRFLYKGIIINHNKKLSQPTLKRRFFKKKAAFFSWPGLGKEWC